MKSKIERPRARFTHPGAEEIYTVHKGRMDAYAAEWGRLVDRIWREEYNEGWANASSVGSCYNAAA